MIQRHVFKLIFKIRIQTVNEGITKSENKKDFAKKSIFELLNIVETKEKETEEKKKVPIISSSEQKENQSPANASSLPAEWHEDEIRLLVKGVKIFAVGTRDRLNALIINHFFEIINKK